MEKKLQCFYYCMTFQDSSASPYIFVLINEIFLATFSARIEEFRIIGFYLYHVTSIMPSNSIGASGSLTASLNIDYDRGSSAYYC